MSMSECPRSCKVRPRYMYSCSVGVLCSYEGMQRWRGRVHMIGEGKVGCVHWTFTLSGVTVVQLWS